MNQRGNQIIQECLQIKDSVNPLTIFKRIAVKDFVRIHGPEHHMLDGASFLTAFYNAGGPVSSQLNLETALSKLMEEGLRMPGATCGLWGVCGSVTSIGAALAIIDGTGPLSVDSSWGDHMKFTSRALTALSKVGGPRCCKRDGFLALQVAVDFANEHYGVSMEKETGACGFFPQNQQCIGSRCPFYPERGL